MTQQIGLGFEGLEERTLLAANVTATLVGDTLYVSGVTNPSDPTGGEDINVVGDGTSGHVEVINNGGSVFVVGGDAVESNQGNFDGVNNIVILGTATDDNIHVADINIAGNLSVQAGLGQDDIYLHTHQFDTFIGGTVVLNGGFSLNDYIEVETEAYGQDLTIGGGLAMVNHGGDYGGLKLAAEYGNISIGGGVLMNTFSLLGSYGSAEIRADYGNLSIGAGVFMNGGTGDDFLGIFAGYGATASGESKTGISITGGVIMNGGWGDDELLIGAYGYGTAIEGIPAPGQPVGIGVSNNIEITGDVQMVAGLGNDLVSVIGHGADVNINGSLNQFGGFGDDTLLVEGFDYGVVNVLFNVLGDGGDGVDFISDYGVLAGGGILNLGGSGDDGIQVEASTVSTGIWAFGQLGSDQFCVQNNVVNGIPGVVFVAGGDDNGVDSAYVANNDVATTEIVVGIEQVLESCPFDA